MYINETDNQDELPLMEEDVIDIENKPDAEKKEKLVYTNIIYSKLAICILIVIASILINTFAPGIFKTIKDEFKAQSDITYNFTEKFEIIKGLINDNL